MGLDKEDKMVHQEVKNFLNEKGIKQSRLSILIEESFPELKFSKNKLNNILNGRVDLTAEDFKIILLTLKQLFPELEANYFYK